MIAAAGGIIETLDFEGFDDTLELGLTEVGEATGLRDVRIDVIGWYSEIVTPIEMLVEAELKAVHALCIIFEERFAASDAGRRVCRAIDGARVSVSSIGREDMVIVFCVVPLAGFVFGAAAEGAGNV